MSATDLPIPSFLNCLSGSAEEVRRIVGGDDRFDLRELQPEELKGGLLAAVRSGARRVMICGGDGSIAVAAGALAGTGVELAILPGGTLNHFARDHGIPTDLPAALETALGRRTATVDVGEVNGRVFLNTLSVGSYVRFVRRRERLERWTGYKLASFVAGLAVLADLRGYSLELEIAGTTQRYSTPLVFIGVGERDLSLPKLGRRREGGTAGLHAMIVTSRARARLVTLTLAAAARGVEIASRTPTLDAFLVNRCRVELSRQRATVAVDGELVHLETPLQLQLLAEALTIVTAEHQVIEPGVSDERAGRQSPAAPGPGP
jgi:diacylglycerol kinase family enzyme